MPFPPLPERLRDASHQTAGFGKTHWGIMQQRPSTRGFEVRAAGPKGLGQEQGAPYQDDGNPQGYAAYHRETADYAPGETIRGQIRTSGTTSTPTLAARRFANN